MNETVLHNYRISLWKQFPIDYSNPAKAFAVLNEQCQSDALRQLLKLGEIGAIQPVLIKIEELYTNILEIP